MLIHAKTFFLKCGEEYKRAFYGRTNPLDQCYAIVQHLNRKQVWQNESSSREILNFLLPEQKKKSMNKQTIRSCEKHHKLNVLVEQQETYWSNKEISDFLSVIPLCYTGGQSNLKHGVTLQDLLQPIKNGLDLLQAQDPGLRLHQRLLIFLKYNSGGRYESLLHSDCDVSIFVNYQ